MDRLTRHELKSDKFVEEVGHTLEYVEEHRTQLYRYGAIALAVILLVAGGWYFMKWRNDQRAASLSYALRVYNAPVGPEINPETITFPTPEARLQGVQKAFQEIISKHGGSNEAAVAHYMLGLSAADRGLMPEAEKHLRDALKDGNGETNALAKLALADVLSATGKPGDAEKLLREVIAAPTTLVSKDQATINLARLLLVQGKRDEARKLLEPMRTQTGAAGRAALTMLGELTQGQ